MLSSVRFLSACALAAGLCVPGLACAAPRGDGTAYHMLLTPAEQARLHRVPSRGASTMLYYGGSVFSSVNAISVIWGANVNKTTVADIGGFLGAIVNSTYVDQLSEYDTNNIVGVNGRKGTGQTIARGTYFGQVQITPKDKKTTLTDKDIRKELEYQISKGVLPANSLNNLYMIYFPSDITINLDGSLSCQAFGAYHEAVSSKVTPNNIFYGVMPDCGGGFGEQTVVSSHEFAEATTDNIPTPGTNPKYPQAWNTSDGYEIGDLCEGNYATLTAGKTSYSVQEVFDNTTGACGTGNFTSP
jgi:hypothetical protein